MRDLEEIRAFVIETKAKMDANDQNRKVLDAANLLYDGYANLWRSEDLAEHALLLDPGDEVTDYVVSFFGKPTRTFQAVTAFHAASEAEHLDKAKVECVYVDRLPFLWRRTVHEGLYYTPIDGLPSDG